MTNTQLQNIVNRYCEKIGIPSIKLVFTDKDLSKGPAYYTILRYRGTKKVIPKYIKIGLWKSLKNYPDELIPVLAHELAHHVNNVLNKSLRHDAKHKKYVRIVEMFLSRHIKDNSREIKRLKDKINYWINNKETLKKEYKDAGLKLNIDQEIKKMQNKLKVLIKGNSKTLASELERRLLHKLGHALKDLLKVTVKIDYKNKLLYIENYCIYFLGDKFSVVLKDEILKEVENNLDVNHIAEKLKNILTKKKTELTKTKFPKDRLLKETTVYDQPTTHIN